MAGTNITLLMVKISEDRPRSDPDVRIRRERFERRTGEQQFGP